MDSDMLVKAEAMDWLEENADEVWITRDVKKGKKVHLSFCHVTSGCSVELYAPTLLDVVQGAIKRNK